jgi:hypothetical protein
MKENSKKSTGVNKIAETINALIENVKRSANMNIGKALFFLLTVSLFFSNGLARAMAKEVMGTIIFEPYSYIDGIDGTCTDYTLDTTGDWIEDTELRVKMLTASSPNDTSTYSTLRRYLREGGTVTFEDKGLTFKRVYRDRIISMSLPNGAQVDLFKLFTIEQIKLEFPYLYEKFAP